MSAKLPSLLQRRLLTVALPSTLASPAHAGLACQLGNETIATGRNATAAGSWIDLDGDSRR